MHPTKIDIDEKSRGSLVDLLNARLADALDLANQSKQAHWNVKGPSFIALHELFDDVADHVREYADDIAERITALGGTALGTIATVAEKTKLPSYPEDIKDGRAHVDALSTSMATFGKHVRAAIEQAAEIGDADTEDLFTEISRKNDKDLWFVEAHIQADE